ncbi:hypothetical protein BpHYR1_043052 [Brachionus plicatilis]|uniref:Uncharacterized protein n=1 Tax=Brachionus plicatilis TaxID=10195 RepID=A0A3M7RFG7_BRAPC|nr:hypothetical protein BpHYR1_043052 [Brachionus plicatilis]
MKSKFAKKRKCFSLEVPNDFKVSKERVSLLFSCSMSGREKLKPLRIQDSDTEIEEQQDANKQVINSKEAIDRINEMKHFFLNKKDDNSNSKKADNSESNSEQQNKFTFWYLLGNKTKENTFDFF